MSYNANREESQKDYTEQNAYILEYVKNTFV